MSTGRTSSSLRALPAAGAERVFAADHQQPAAHVVDVRRPAFPASLRRSAGAGDVGEDDAVVLLSCTRLLGNWSTVMGTRLMPSAASAFGQHVAGAGAAADVVDVQHLPLALDERERVADVVDAERVALVGAGDLDVGVAFEDGAELVHAAGEVAGHADRARGSGPA